MVHNGEYLKLRIVEEGNIIERCSNGIFSRAIIGTKGKYLLPNRRVRCVEYA